MRVLVSSYVGSSREVGEASTRGSEDEGRKLNMARAGATGAPRRICPVRATESLL
jgi:hypothetical protein